MAKYALDYAPEFEDDIKKFEKAGEKITLKKISILLKELEVHPKTGTGHPEPLKGRMNCWSRRITSKHRLVYEIQDDIVVVLVLSAYGHYDDK